MALTFDDDYARLENLFRKRATQDGDVFLPRVPPHSPVDFILIGMEPSLKRWSKSAQDAQVQIDSGFKDFLFSVEDFIVHFCVRKYLCHEGQTYYLTNVAKGAMPVQRARQNRRERYDRWYTLLKEEIALVGKPNVKIFAIGKVVERFLTTKGFGPVAATILHYSSQASGYRRRLIQGREREFQRFTATVNLRNIAKVTEDVLTEAKVAADMGEKILARIRKSSLSDSRKQLIFGYKAEFEKCSKGKTFMTTSDERYIVDEEGNRVGVLLNITDYEKLLEELEELDSIRAYDAAKASGDEAIPIEEAFDEIDRG